MEKEVRRVPKPERLSHREKEGQRETNEKHSKDKAMRETDTVRYELRSSYIIVL